LRRTWNGFSKDSDVQEEALNARNIIGIVVFVIVVYVVLHYLFHVI
jgi:hypothetical protein